METKDTTEKPEGGVVAALRAAGTVLAERARLALQAGKTFGAKRDLYAALGYSRDLQPKDFRDRYKRNGIAARIVEAAPKATWRGGAELIEDEDPEVSTEFEEAWDELNKRLGIWPIFARADILAGLGRFSVILIGAPGKFEEELPKTLKPEDIAYLTPISEEEVQIVTWDEDPMSPRFGMPTEYRIQRLGSASKVTIFSKVIHWTRVLHIADGLLDDRVYGQPRLERVWNDLDDLEKIKGGGAEAFWRRAHQGLVFSFDKDVEVDSDEVKRIEEATDDLVHDFRRTIGARGMTVTQLGSDVANFNQQVDAIITLIAGASGIPKRILVGSERGELSSAQDKTTWDDYVSDRRQDFAEPRVVRPLVDLFIKLGVLPKPKEYTIRWPELLQMDDEQKAAIAEKWAGLNQKAGVTVVTGNEIRDRVLGLDPFDDEIAGEQAVIDEHERKVEAADTLLEAQKSGLAEKGQAAGQAPPAPGKKAAPAPAAPAPAKGKTE